MAFNWNRPGVKKSRTEAVLNSMTGESRSHVTLVGSSNNHGHNNGRNSDAGNASSSSDQRRQRIRQLSSPSHQRVFLISDSHHNNYIRGRLDEPQGYHVSHATPEVVFRLPSPDTDRKIRSSMEGSEGNNISGRRISHFDDINNHEGGREGHDRLKGLRERLNPRGIKDSSDGGIIKSTSFPPMSKSHLCLTTTTDPHPLSSTSESSELSSPSSSTTDLSSNSSREGIPNKNEQRTSYMYQNYSILSNAKSSHLVNESLMDTAVNSLEGSDERGKRVTKQNQQQQTIRTSSLNTSKDTFRRKGLKVRLGFTSSFPSNNACASPAAFKFPFSPICLPPKNHITPEHDNGRDRTGSMSSLISSTSSSSTSSHERKHSNEEHHHQRHRQQHKLTEGKNDACQEDVDDSPLSPTTLLLNNKNGHHYQEHHQKKNHRLDQSLHPQQLFSHQHPLRDDSHLLDFKTVSGSLRPEATTSSTLLPSPSPKISRHNSNNNSGNTDNHNLYKLCLSRTSIASIDSSIHGKSCSSSTHSSSLASLCSSCSSTCSSCALRPKNSKFVFHMNLPLQTKDWHFALLLLPWKSVVTLYADVSLQDICILSRVLVLDVRLYTHFVSISRVTLWQRKVRLDSATKCNWSWFRKKIRLHSNFCFFSRKKSRKGVKTSSICLCDQKYITVNLFARQQDTVNLLFQEAKKQSQKPMKEV